MNVRLLPIVTRYKNRDCSTIFSPERRSALMNHHHQIVAKYIKTPDHAHFIHTTKNVAFERNIFLIKKRKCH